MKLRKIRTNIEFLTTGKKEKKRQQAAIKKIRSRRVWS